MTPEERERMIRSHSMTANERFLIGLLDEARTRLTEVLALSWHLDGESAAGSLVRDVLDGSSAQNALSSEVD